jgi:hypothetical protein
MSDFATSSRSGIVSPTGSRMASSSIRCGAVLTSTHLLIDRSIPANPFVTEN